MDKERKQRVIHTRVSETLEEELRDRAAALGVSVSNLVRNVLENTLGLVEGVIADSAEVARRAGARASAAVSPPGTVVAWQQAVMALNAVCQQCNVILLKGSDAAIGIVEGGGPRPVLCLACLENMRGGDKETPDA